MASGIAKVLSSEEKAVPSRPLPSPPVAPKLDAAKKAHTAVISQRTSVPVSQPTAASSSASATATEKKSDKPAKTYSAATYEEHNWPSRFTATRWAREAFFARYLRDHPSAVLTSKDKQSMWHKLTARKKEEWLQEAIGQRIDKLQHAYFDVAKRFYKAEDHPRLQQLGDDYKRVQSRSQTAQALYSYCTVFHPDLIEKFTKYEASRATTTESSK